MNGITYKTAFNIELKHNFYVADADKSQVNRYLKIAPTEECNTLLGRGRMLFFPDMTGATMLYKSIEGDTSPFVTLPDNIQFVFALSLADSTAFFMNVTDFTDFSADFSAGNKILLDGDDTTSSPVTLTPSLIDRLVPVSSVLSFAISGGGSTADVTVKDEEGNEVMSFTVPEGIPSETYNAPLDFTGLPKGKYSFSATSNSITYTAVLYYDNDLAMQNNIFGIVRLKYATASKLYSSPFTFTYSFANRSTKWRYYIVAKNFDTTGVTMAVIDDTSGGYTFDSSNPTTQPYGNPDTNVVINGYPTYVMTSGNEVPLTDEAINSFNLWQDNGTSSLLLQSLSNAVLGGTDSDRLAVANGNPPVLGFSEIFVII